jgi:hypothetical protein
MWCYLADGDDHVYSSEYLEKMQISEESKQAIKAALFEDPNKRTTLRGFVNFLAKIKGYDQQFKEADLESTTKNPKNLVSVPISAEDIKIRPIHANLIYHICSLLYKLSATNVFYEGKDCQPVIDSIANILEIGCKLLQANKVDPQNYDKYFKDTRKYADIFRKYYQITPTSMGSNSRTTGTEELIMNIEQKFMQSVRDYILQANPFDTETAAENTPLIRNCKRFFVVCYFLITMDHRSETHEEEGIIMFKLTKLNKEDELEREFKLFLGKFEMPKQSNPSNNNSSATR